jgi:hypothetical protein
MAKQTKTTKHTQKKNIIDMMQSDEQLNMYNETLDQSTTQSAVDITIGNTPDIQQDSIADKQNDTPVNTKSTTVDKTNSTTNNKAARIIQKRPSHYSLLMEDGSRIVVHKSMFDKQTMTIKADE